MKRVFVAINLPEEIKDKLIKCPVRSRGTLRALAASNGIRWTKKNGLHITLFFIGEIDEKEIARLKTLIAEAVKNHKPFDIYLTDISVGPDEKRPRMIWANGPLSEELKSLQKDLADRLRDFAVKDETRMFKLHITLARAGFSRIKPFREEISLKFRVESIELMESELLADGAKHSVLERFDLK